MHCIAAWTRNMWQNYMQGITLHSSTMQVSSAAISRITTFHITSSSSPSACTQRAQQPLRRARAGPGATNCSFMRRVGADARAKHGAFHLLLQLIDRRHSSGQVAQLPGVTAGEGVMARRATDPRLSQFLRQCLMHTRTLDELSNRWLGGDAGSFWQQGPAMASVTASPDGFSFYSMQSVSF